MFLQTLIDALYPPQCFLCDTPLAHDMGLCPSCRKDFTFFSGALCECCAQPLPGYHEAGLRCDRCLHTPPPWRFGRSVLLYAEGGRSFVLALKLSDRTDLARPAGRWMAQAADDLIIPKTLIVPVPLHWRRRIARRYNQAALLAKEVALSTAGIYAPRALVRERHTPTLDRLDRTARVTALEGVIQVAVPADISGQHCLLVDDVLTSGATLSACTRALLEAGAKEVDVVTLARVALYA